MTDGTVRSSRVGSGHADGRQADSARALVEMITRQRELEGMGQAATAYEAVYAEPASRGDTDASNAPGACGDVPGAQPVRHNDSRPPEAASAAPGRGATAAAADALLAVFAIDEEQWARLLADLPLDTLTELLGHTFRLYQRIATEETNRRFEQDVVRPPEPSSSRAAAER